jgi:TRAP-type C4-dicarboxylate transport system permease small subunit
MRNPVEKTLEIATFIAFSGLIIIVLFQIITRFFFPDFSKVWTEEATRLFFVYSVAFAAPLAMKKQEYVNVDILISLFPKKLKKIIEILNQILIIILISILLKGAVGFSQLGLNQLSPTMKIPMSVAYSSLFVALLFLLIYGIHNLVIFIRNKDNGGEEQ